MEKGSHSVAPLIMYGTDGAARLWTTGGPSHVPVEPSGNVLQITHVSPRFTKRLYLAPHSQRRELPNLLAPFQYGLNVGSRHGNEQTVRAFFLAPTFCCFTHEVGYFSSSPKAREVTVEQTAITVDKQPCHVLLKEKISVSLEMTRGAKIARLQPPLSVKLSRVLLCEECVRGGGPTWTDITVSHLLL